MTTNSDTSDNKSRPKEDLHTGSKSPVAQNEVINTTGAEWHNVSNFFKPNDSDKLLARADLILPDGKTEPSSKIFSIENAKEIVNGKEIPLNPNEKLAPGDHVLRFPFEKQGKHKGEFGFREAVVHIPPPDPANPDKAMPVVFAFHGALPESLGPDKFRTTLDLDKKADDKGIIVVYPHAELHDIKEGGVPAYAWNVAGALIDPADVKRHAAEVGHNESDFIAGLPKIIKQVTTAVPYDSPNLTQNQKWGIAAHSQGVPSMVEFLGDSRLEGVFPKVVAICGTREKGNTNQIANGNAETVVVIDPGGDKTIVPSRMDKQGQAVSKLFSQVSKYIDPTGLGAINVATGNPQELITFFLKHVGTADNLERLRQVFIPSDPNKQHMSVADYSKRVDKPDSFNPDAISKVDTLNVFTSANGKRMFLFHAPDSGHIVLGGNHPSAYDKLSSASIIVDLMTGNLQLASLEKGRSD